MDNRRNFYRVLHVQPDAANKVIQQSYRSLMQKMRLHPDLGGDNHHAAIINQAYATLRNPKVRAAYDTKLRNRYSIKTLASIGGFNSSATNETMRQNGNQRNYYRILNIQNDTESEVIKSSYHTLSKLVTNENKPLLNEAFYVVGNITRRRQYDTLLRLHTHAASVRKLKMAQHIKIKSTNSNIRNSAINTRSITKQKNESKIKPATALKPISSLGIKRQSAIKYHCKFCKTPYVNGYFMKQKSFCNTCESPLSLSTDGSINTSQRNLPRMQQSKKVYIYECWPGDPLEVSLEDLSPSGLNFYATQTFNSNQIIKIDACNFKAVAKVVYCCQNNNSINSIGVSFITIQFLSTTGSFLSTSA